MDNKEIVIKGRLATHFRNINLLFVILILIIMMGISAVLIFDLTDKVSENNARFYAIDTASILSSYLSKELTLVEHATKSADIINWFMDEDDPDKKAAAYRQMMLYSGMLQIDGMYFAIKESLNEFDISSTTAFEDFQPFFRLDPERLYDQWFFEALESSFDFTLNLDVDKTTNTRRLWINHKVMHNGNAIGILCSAIQFDSVFNEMFSQYDHNSMIGYILDQDGIIQISSYIPEPDLLQVDFTGDVFEERHITEIITDPFFKNAINTFLENPQVTSARADPDVIRLDSSGFQYVSISPIPNTNWLAVTMYRSSSLFDFTSLIFQIFVVIFIFIVYVVSSSVMIKRIFFDPLTRLTRSISIDNSNGYVGIYGINRDDEIGVLARETQRAWDQLNEYNKDLTAAVFEREKAVEAAKAASRSKTDFLANMSHEIRTPMNSIIGFSELALDDNLPDKTKDFLEKIIENSKWLLQIINDILDISKIESGKMDLENIPFDLGDLFNTCHNAILTKVAEKDLTLHCYAEPSIGKRLYGDPVKLRQILMNLLSNAVKFTNTGTIKVQSFVKSIERNRVTVFFEVKDSGIGISEEQIKRIFDPFTQAESGTTRKYGGSGLGLPITKNIIEMMGGTLNVDSTPGTGSKFSFELTFDASDDSDDNEITESTSPESIERPMFEGEILLCEDNIMNQEVICEHLARVGLKTVIANNGKVGVEMVVERNNAGSALKKQFDLVLMDIHMPVMDGLEAAVKILELNPDIPIVAMTANVLSDDRNIYNLAGMKDIVGKPFTSQELWRCLMKYLKPVKVQQENLSELKHSDSKLRQRLIKTFLQNNEGIYGKINDAIDADDIKLAHRLAHTLKSNAGQLELLSLQQAAKAVEEMLATGENFATPQQMRALESEVNAALTELTPQLQTPAEPVTETGTMDATAALTLLTRLKPMLRDSNFDCMTFIDELKLIKGSEALIEQIENLDFKPAMETLNKLLEDL